MPMEYEIACCIRGYHVYHEMWEAAVGEVVVCEIELRNATDRYAAAVKRGTEWLSDTYRERCGMFACFSWGKRQSPLGSEVHLSVEEEPSHDIKASYMEVLNCMHMRTDHMHNVDIIIRCKISLVLSFRGLWQPRKNFTNENFPIYGTAISFVFIHATYSCIQLAVGNMDTKASNLLSFFAGPWVWDCYPESGAQQQESTVRFPPWEEPSCGRHLQTETCSLYCWRCWFPERKLTSSLEGIYL